MTSEKKLQKIKILVSEFTFTDIYKERQDRLKLLIDKHGIECVCLASGITENSLRQYTRSNTPVSIGENAVYQAEQILNRV